jgi:hypothetical protein
MTSYQIGFARQRLPTRGGCIGFGFEHEGHRYHATARRYDDGRLAEIFLNVGQIDSALQKNAETSAILVSLLLQHGVAADEIVHSIAGPAAVAIQLAEAS